MTRRARRRPEQVQQSPYSITSSAMEKPWREAEASWATCRSGTVLSAWGRRFRVPAGPLFQLHFDEFQRRGPGIGQ